MTTLMVRLELGQSNAKVLTIVGDLAKQLDAGVVGVAVCQPLRMAYGDSYLSGDVIQADREGIENETATAEAEFRTALEPVVKKLDFRSAITFEPLSDNLARQARIADIIVTAVERRGFLLNSSRHLNVSDLLMQAGRPVLIVPANLEVFRLDRVLVGWKDTRETRRAVLDALPVLRKAGHVTVVEIADGQDLDAAHARLAEVTAWLHDHGVDAGALVELAAGDDASRLGAIAAEQRADLIVAGAYGHNRFREWALGGVTSDLLLRAGKCSLVSH